MSCDINLMTLGRWHSTKSQRLVKIKENNHNTHVVYLLIGIDRHVYLIEIFLACLNINMKHSKKIDVEMCRLRPVASQCRKSLFPTAAMCVKTVSKRLDTSVVKGKCQPNVTGFSGMHILQCRHFVDICMVPMSCHDITEQSWLDWGLVSSVGLDDLKKSSRYRSQNSFCNAI